VTNIVNIPATGSDPACPVNRPKLVYERQLGLGSISGHRDGLALVRFLNSGTTVPCDPRVLTEVVAPLSYVPGGSVRVAKTPHKRDPVPVLPSDSKPTMIALNDAWNYESRSSQKASHGRPESAPRSSSLTPVSCEPMSATYDPLENNGEERSPMTSTLYPIDPVLQPNRSKHDEARLSRKQRLAFKLVRLLAREHNRQAICDELRIGRTEYDELVRYAEHISPGVTRKPASFRVRDPDTKKFSRVLEVENVV
jgi:hypothetical protein